MGRTWITPSKNPSVYRKRHVLKVWFGTGETLPCTAKAVKKLHISQGRSCELARRESEAFIVPEILQTTKLQIGKGRCFIQVSKGGKSE
jgi:hypothetical protein